MLRLILLAGVVAAALVRGGSLANLAGLRLRWVPLVALGFVIQIVIFSSLRAFLPVDDMGIRLLYLLSMALLTVWVALNRRIPGMALMAVGLLCNFLAIAANGGYMPVSPASARLAGTIALYHDDGGLRFNNSVASDENVRLWLLTDIIPVPRPVPFANVWSIGDVLLTVGAGVLCYRTVSGRREAEKNEYGVAHHGT